MKKNKNLQLVIFALSFILSLALTSVMAQNCPPFEGVKSSRQKELLTLANNTTFQITVENQSKSPITVKIYHSVDANPGTTAFSTHQVAAKSSSKLTNLWYAGDWGIQINDSCVRYLADVGEVGSQRMMMVAFGTTQKSCKELGFTEPREGIDGVWQFEHSGGVIVHEATLYMSENSGKVITQYYDEIEDQTQYVEQQVMLCQSSGGIMLLGSNQMNFLTGSKFISYNADNFSMKRMPNGKFEIYNDDGNGDKSKVDIKDFRELNDSDKKYLLRTYF